MSHVLIPAFLLTCSDYVSVASSHVLTADCSSDDGSEFGTNFGYAYGEFCADEW